MAYKQLTLECLDYDDITNAEKIDKLSLKEFYESEWCDNLYEYYMDSCNKYEEELEVEW